MDKLIWDIVRHKTIGNKMAAIGFCRFRKAPQLACDGAYTRLAIFNIYLVERTTTKQARMADTAVLSDLEKDVLCDPRS